MINFVSNLPQDLRSGGFSAMNITAFEALWRVHAVHYAGPIDPPVQTWRKGVSKLIRIAGGAGDFALFSQVRLKAIAAEVLASCRDDAMADFFHGFTPWIRTRPERRYIAWSDCTFRDYITIYHRRASFRATDLARIEAAEAAWLKGARRVAFTSTWAAERAVRDYGLDEDRIAVVGIFGETELPETDAYNGSMQFAFVCTNFEAKGGPIVLRAFRQVRERCPDASLVIVGDSPQGVEGEPGVTAAGFLRKEDHVQNRRLRDILAGSRALVHPTRSDVAPLLPVEAGYFGCPVISARRFAIPEIVEHGHTGLLLDNPSDSKAVAAAMTWMLEAEADYRSMRRAAWTRTRRAHTKARFEERLLACVNAALENTRSHAL